MQLRHENKYLIDAHDMILLSGRLAQVAILDPNAKDGTYHIRSLYFDSAKDSALRDNLSGASNREKFRIRYYNGDTSVIHLEKKIKRGGLGCKIQCSLSKEETEKLILGDYSWMPNSSKDIAAELYSKIVFEGLTPKTIVDYKREAYIYESGNVRVTFDSEIRTSKNKNDFFDSSAPGVPVNGSPIIMELKWDNYLPDVINDVLQSVNKKQSAYSKYVSSRMLD